MQSCIDWLCKGVPASTNPSVEERKWAPIVNKHANKALAHKLILYDDDKIERLSLMGYMVKTRKHRMGRRYRKLLRKELLGIETKKVRDSRTVTPSYRHSDFRKFIKRAKDDDPAWFGYVSLSGDSFKKLAALCEKTWASVPICVAAHGSVCATPRPADIQRRVLDCQGTVGLTLYYLNSKDPQSKNITRLFGIVDTSVSEYLNFGKYVVLSVLRRIKQGEIYWDCTNIDYLEKNVAMVRAAVPRLVNEYRFKPVAMVDGTTVEIMNKWSRREDQKEDYNAWKERPTRKALLLFDYFGDIVMAMYNNPGRDHDSFIAACVGLYERAQNDLPKGYCIFGDPAFQGGPTRKDKVVTVLKKNEPIPECWHGDKEGLKEVLGDITVLRQPVEWAMNGAKSACNRLRIKLSDNDEKNKELFELVFRFWNYQNRTCQRQQVKNYFQGLQAAEKFDQEMEKLGKE